MKFYSEKETKLMVANAATAAATEATINGTKKAATFGGLGMLLGAAITVTCGRSYVKRIEKETVEANASLKKDIRILRAGVVEADQALAKMNADYSKLPAVREAARLIIERTDPEAYKKLLLEEQKAKEDKKKKEENKNKKGGDK